MAIFAATVGTGASLYATGRISSAQRELAEPGAPAIDNARLGPAPPARDQPIHRKSAAARTDHQVEQENNHHGVHAEHQDGVAMDVPQ